MSNQDPAEAVRQQAAQDRTLKDGHSAFLGDPAAVPEEAPPPRRSPVATAAPAIGGAALLAVVGWLLWKLRLRRRPPTPQERLAAAARHGVRSAAEVAEQAAAVAVPALATATGLALREGARAGSAVVSHSDDVVRVATDVAGKAVQAATGLGSAVGGGVTGAAESVVETAEDIVGWWARWLNRLLLLGFGFAGYVLGARAGRERYEQIASAARGLAQRFG